MTEDQRAATAAVMHFLAAAERAKDASLRAQSDLMTTLIDGGVQARLHPGESQPLLEHFHRAMAADLDARRRLVVGHARLARLAASKGFDFSAMGDEGQTNWEQAKAAARAERDPTPADT